MIFGPETLSGRSTTDLTVFDSQRRLRRGLPIRLVVPARRDAEKQQLRHENSICGSERSYDMNLTKSVGNHMPTTSFAGCIDTLRSPNLGFGTQEEQSPPQEGVPSPTVTKRLNAYLVKHVSLYTHRK